MANPQTPPLSTSEPGGGIPGVQDGLHTPGPYFGVPPASAPLGPMRLAAGAATLKPGELVELNGGTATLPTLSAAEIGATVGVIAVNGPITVSSGAGNIFGNGLVGVSSFTLQQDATVYLTWDSSNWFIGSLIGSGRWTALILGTKIEQAGVPWLTAESRLEQAGTRGALRGAIKVKAGETLTGGETAFTLPLVTRPTASVGLPVAGNIVVGGGDKLTITSGGTASFTATFGTAVILPLDGLSWSIT